MVLHMANGTASFVEGIEMLKRGGNLDADEVGVFADVGDVSINVHRHVCSKNIRLIGLTNHPSTGYGPRSHCWSAMATGIRLTRWSAMSSASRTSTSRCARA